MATSLELPIAIVVALVPALTGSCGTVRGVTLNKFADRAYKKFCFSAIRDLWSLGRGRRGCMTGIGKTALRLCVVGLAGLAIAPAEAYDTGAVTDGGSIEGTVTFNGTVGTRKIIPTKDVETCGGVREDALIDVGPGKAVKEAVVYLVGVGKGKPWPPPGKKPELDNVHCRFVPQVQVIPAGPLDVVNKDPVLHNTHGYYGRRTAFNTALPNQGQDIPADLPRAGTVRVDCDAHGWMEGWIYVRDNPYYAITGADGRFKIGDVPPGDYTLVAIQSFTGPTEQKVTVAAGKPTSLAIELKKK